MRLVLDYRPALKNRSGVGEYVYQLARAIGASHATGGPDSAIEMTLFSSSWKDRVKPPAGIRGATVVDRRVPVSLLNFAWHRIEWPAIEMLIGGAVDVAHSLHPLLMPARHAAQVVTIHDLNFLAHPERTRAEIRRDYPPLVRSHAARADHILVPSRFTAGEVERLLSVAADRITVCSPGAPEWAPIEPSRHGYLLFLGTLEPRKNVGTLLDAYERLLARRESATPDLVLAGKATPEAAPWLERIGRPPLAGRVKAIGYVHPDNRLEVYSGACALVQPSFEEGFGIPVLEAMTLGLPVVAANRGALPEVLGEAGLLIDAEDSEQLASGLERVTTDPVFAARCREAGIARSRMFSWSASAERAIDAYRSAISRKRARRPR